MKGSTMQDLGIVRAIDVGYRNCKYVEKVDGDRIVCQTFPSIAPVASDRDLGVDRSTRRNTMVVPVGNVRYEVGAEAALAQAADETHNLDDTYVLTDPYLALVRGALRQMRVPRVDLLIVGLPVSLFKKRRAELEKRLQGEHDLGDDTAVHVARVKAMAQPMGAFLSYAVPHAQRDAMLRERNVIVDPGWRTFDWVVTQSLKVLDKRSDAVNKGMAAVVHAIAEAIGSEIGSRLSRFDHDRIDAALRTKTAPKFFGQPCDLEPFIDAGKRVVLEAITEMRRLVQDASDIDNFVLAGGGAFFYRAELQKAFPKHRILQVDEPLFANVRGFQIAGMEIMAAGARQPAQSRTDASA
ncbi:MAG TPA: PRTRC system protein D [Burkholderiaceae bacterium]|nr:PRTRC system protein D [Burkholderiaceae bacterium]